MRSLVVDSSVVIKWMVEEEGTDLALGLRQHRLLAPDIVIAECANILWKKVLRNEMALHEAAMAALLLQRAEIDLAPMRNLLESAFQLAWQLERPAYDCMYLALAIASSCDVATADAALVRRSAELDLPIRVLSLRDAVADA